MTSLALCEAQMEKIRLIWALLFFNLLHYLKNNRSEKNIGGAGKRLAIIFNFSSCFLWKLPQNLTETSKITAHLCGRLHEWGWRKHWPHIVFVGADIINTGVNYISFSHSTVSWVEFLLQNHRFKQNDLLFYQYWQIYTSAFLRQHNQSLIETVYIISSYTWNTKINSIFIRWILLLHVFHSYQVTFIKTGTPPDAGFQCTLCIF